jgi:SAM-dependent methyltransferase
MKNSKFILFIIQKIWVPAYFFVTRFFKDQLFLRNLQRKELEPYKVLLPVILIIRTLVFLRKKFESEFTDYAIKKYNKYINFHYSKEGRGYFSYGKLTDEEKKALFGTPNGRLSNFVNKYSNVLNYKNGESFFDVGCGRGQNIKILLEAYPLSKIHGIDLSEDAIDVVNLSVKSDLVTAEAANLKELDVLRAVKDNSFDHVIMSHVFSLIMADGVESTKVLRQQIVTELIRIVNKSVFILDSSAITSQKTLFEIEQLHRGVFKESILGYFKDFDGTLLTLNCESSTGVLFQKMN